MVMMSSREETTIQSRRSPVFFNRPTVSSLIPSPGFFAGFSPKGFSGSEADIMCPTSILEAKPFSLTGHDFVSDRKPKSCSTTSPEKPWDGGGSKVGLGIVDDEKSFNGEGRRVFFGSQLKVQIPPASLSYEPHSLIEHGVKNKGSRLATSLLLLLPPPPPPQRRAESTPMALPLSPSEMELSEDYTRVISHGPNPKTIQIFDSCILQRCGADSSPCRYPSDDFLSFCQSCRKKLGQEEDIFMYRGELAFCSHECRDREMLFDDGMKDFTAR